MEAWVAYFLGLLGVFSLIEIALRIYRRFGWKRDPEYPCSFYSRGAPRGSCESDGHYLCNQCKNLKKGARVMDKKRIRRCALSIVRRIVEDLIGRYGLRQEWEQIDKETRIEIRSTWRELVEGVLTYDLPWDVDAMAEEWEPERKRIREMDR